MELAIQTIVTLFVAIAVGVMVITFGQKMLSSAPKVIVKDNVSERMIWVPNASLVTIAGLVKECYKTHVHALPKNDFCYAVATDQPINISKSALAPYLDLNQNAYEVDSTTTKSIAIVWNAENSKVEVKG